MTLNSTSIGMSKHPYQDPWTAVRFLLSQYGMLHGGAVRAFYLRVTRLFFAGI
jgi:hypothetical protein